MQIENVRTHQFITITILDIIHRPDFYLKHNVSETGFCFSLQIEPTQLDPLDRASLCLARPILDPEDGGDTILINVGLCMD
jgi:hypothetical protein